MSMTARHMSRKVVADILCCCGLSLDDDGGQNAIIVRMFPDRPRAATIVWTTELMTNWASRHLGEDDDVKMIELAVFTPPPTEFFAPSTAGVAFEKASPASKSSCSNVIDASGTVDEPLDVVYGVLDEFCVVTRERSSRVESEGGSTGVFGAGTRVVFDGGTVAVPVGDVRRTIKINSRRRDISASHVLGGR